MREESIYELKPFPIAEVDEQDFKMEIETDGPDRVHVKEEHERDTLPEMARHQESPSDEQYIVHTQSKLFEEQDFFNFENEKSPEMQCQLSLINDSENGINLAGKIFENNFDFWGTLEPENWKLSSVKRKKIAGEKRVENKDTDEGPEKPRKQRHWGN